MPSMTSNTTQKMENDSLPIAPSLAARMLSSSLGESEGIWVTRLANWRRPGRTGPIAWNESEAGKPGYDFQAVRTFIDSKLAMRAALAPPRTDDAVRVSAVADVECDKPFVRILWNAGPAQGGINVSTATAKELVQKLVRAIATAEQPAGGRVLNRL